ncbi:hypothetical protein F5Y14DRAFT_437151 [Nemania sp. NC0429]|nr:hypothetical protein F5Y14DRAFT_437151 [Nemania sp. NC0429]
MPKMKAPATGAQPPITAIVGSDYNSSLYADSEYPDTMSQASNNWTKNKSNIVDYVLVIKPLDNTLFSNTIEAIIKEESHSAGTPTAINHTNYQPIRFSPIACSIETKKPNQAKDPRLQLFTWGAAWHKRIGQVRPTSSTLIPSALLIQVEGHFWSIHYLCDQGEEMCAYGPQNIGSTENLEQLYALYASLQGIKKWMKNTFSLRMSNWLRDQSYR